MLSCLPVLSFSLGMPRRLVAVVDALSGMVNTDMLLLLCSRVKNAGSLQMSYWKLQQHRNCESKLQRNHYRLCLNYLGYDLYRHITATSTYMLRRPIATISCSISTSYHNITSYDFPSFCGLAHTPLSSLLSWILPLRPSRCCVSPTIPFVAPGCLACLV
jgi:hypothetical protein